MAKNKAMDEKDVCIVVVEGRPNRHFGSRAEEKSQESIIKEVNPLLIVLKVTYSCKKFCVSSAGCHCKTPGVMNVRQIDVTASGYLYFGFTKRSTTQNSKRIDKTVSFRSDYGFHWHQSERSKPICSIDSSFGSSG